tara:strand:- start:48 stop:578 length:531 start_codon:yes stop_codon:yes gene_type:complete
MKWDKDLIIVKDNFLDETVFKKIYADLDTVKFESRYGREKRGDGDKIYFDVPLSQDHSGPLALRSFLKDEFGIIVTKMKSFYLLTPKHKEPTPHHDLPFKINCIIYLKGPTFIHNGTALYENEKKGELWDFNTLVGFKENRMLMFSAGKMHASLQSEEGATGRFIMSNWINEYELE